MYDFYSILNSWIIHSYMSLDNSVLVYESVVKTNFSNIGDQFFGYGGCSEERRSMAP